MSFPYTIIASKEDGFAEFLYIPSHKPDASRLLDIIILPEIIEYTSITTAKGLSFEGQRLTGLRAIVHMGFKIKISYISSTSDQTTHAVHYNHFKSISFEIPEQVHNSNILSLLDSGQLNISPFITSIATKSINERCIQVYITLLVQASMP